MTTSPRPIAGARGRRGFRGPALAAVAAALLAAGCGKKGPPLAPLPRVPVAPTEVTAERAGDVVTVRFTVPTANISGVRPADVTRVDVHALTTPPLAPDVFVKHAPVVGSVSVRRPPPPPPEPREGEAAPPPPPPPTGPGLDQGARGQVVETLTPASLVQFELPTKKKPKRPALEPSLTPPDVGPPLPELPVRSYLVVGVNHRGRRGSPSPRISVPLWEAPPAPTALRVAISESAITLSWDEPEGLRRPILPNALPPPLSPVGRPAGTATPVTPAPAAATAQPPPVQAGAPAVSAVAPRQGADAPAAATPASTPLGSRTIYPWPVFKTGYAVYEVSPPSAVAAPAEPGAVPPFPKKLTDVLVTVPSFSVPNVTAGIDRCFVVRTVETAGTLTHESADSAPVCVNTQDVFAPAAPKNLAAVASEGGISLIWEANTEPDLAGYIVLRGIAGSQALQPLTPAPIREATYRDTAATPGTRYVYAVVAVDKAAPQNVSAQSNRVEETAR